MTEAERREAARKFINDWSGKPREKQDAQKFWMSLLRDIYGLQDINRAVQFEQPVTVDGQQKYIDVYLPETRVMVEQKGSSKDLGKPEPQSGGLMLTPYQQAKRYANNMPLDEMPRYIVTCNFREFWIYDQNKPGQDPEVIRLDALQDAAYRMEFLVKKEHASLSEEMQLSMQAGEIVGRIYDAFYSQYKDPSTDRAQKSLNALCVRLVFCLYAEDAGLFGRHGMFHDYLASYPTKHMRSALISLFRVLDQPEDVRDPYLTEDLAAFPYVNGGLFSDEDIEIPPFTDEIRDLLLQHASEDFDWSSISPTIFGAVFESTLNPQTRRSGGMHYTSIENIHKVIDPLFLDKLRAELAEIEDIAVVRTRKARLENFQDKLASLTFLDPACGSGNFLTETYLSLRRLENEVLRQRIAADRSEVAGQIMFDLGGTYSIKVSIGQFYGIEINDFAVTVAKTALWISEEQMMRETQEILHSHIEFLPLKSYANIAQGNALQMDWSDIVSKETLNFIIGNPPFVGFKKQSDSQRKDMSHIAYNRIKKVGVLDYVCGWYIKAADFIENSAIHCAFVSTNSITQGEQPAILWEFLYSKNISIDFAYRTFIWESESKKKASVHCVIIAFSYVSQSRTHPAVIYDNGTKKIVNNISPYLIDCGNIIVKSRKNPLCNVPVMIAGNKTVKTLALIMDRKEKDEFIKCEPKSEKWFKRMIGSDEFINNKERYCLWLVGISPKELREMPLVLARVEQVKKDRLSSDDKQAHALANTPTTFRDTNNPDHALIVPLVSSERRRYIPIGYIDDSVIANNKVSMVPDASIYHFGVIASNVHNAWMRCIAMRMKSDYSYSLSVVYNTFPWPTPTPEQKQKIEQTAQGILDARAIYPDSSLADLYDPLTMPPELRKAHAANDRAVMQAYGMPIRETDEAACVAWLMRMYQELTSS